MLKRVLFGICLFIFIAGVWSLVYADCEPCDFHKDRWREEAERIEEDLAAFRAGKIKRYRGQPYAGLEGAFQWNLECIEKVCNPDEIKKILGYWKRIQRIIDSGELPSGAPMIDPMPRRR